MHLSVLKKTSLCSSTVIASRLTGARRLCAVTLAAGLCGTCLLSAQSSGVTPVVEKEEKVETVIAEQSPQSERQNTAESEEQRARSVPELSTSILIGLGGILLIFRKRRTV